MNNKRKVSILIPYIFKNNTISVYLQKRSKDAKRLPDCFGFFGGGIEENESPEQALRREMKEEINFVPEGYSYFKKYNFSASIKNFFILKVDKDFENKITVFEGEYGKWFTEPEVFNEPKLFDEDRLVLQEFFEFLKTQK